jgi:hypothetical protein
MDETPNMLGVTNMTDHPMDVVMTFTFQLAHGFVYVGLLATAQHHFGPFPYQPPHGC